MEIKVLPESHGVRRIELIGRLTQDGWAHWSDPLVARLGEDVYGQQLLIGLQRSLYFDSTGVEWLINWHKRFRSAGGRMVLHSANPATQQLFKMMRMDKVLEIELTESDALKRLEARHASPVESSQPAVPEADGATGGNG